MKINPIENLKRTPKRIYVYSTLAVVLALVTLLVLNYFEFYVHELGHGTAAMVDAVASGTNSITLNFTYQKFLFLGKDIGLRYPQQTAASSIHTVFNPLFKISGVLFSFVFYGAVFSLVAFALSKNERLKSNKRVDLALVAVLFLIVFYDILSNMVCGTDGINLSCSNTFLIGFMWFFLVFELGFLGYFYMEIFFYKTVNLGGDQKKS